MKNGLSCTSLAYAGLLAGFLLGDIDQGWGAARSYRHPAFHGVAAEATVKIVAEYDFDSYEALVEWLREQGVTEDPLELEDLLEQLGQESLGIAQTCLSAQARPDRIDVTTPFFIKLIQLSFPTTVVECGLVLCGRMQFSLEWFIAPTGGAFFLGPTPRATREEVCVGDTVVPTAFLILTGAIPPGSYSLTFRASSDALGSTVADVEILVR